MNNETPTPGSWNVHTDDNGKHSVIGFGPLAHLGDSPRALANARLMAAAPDMLSALSELAELVSLCRDLDWTNPPEELVSILTTIESSALASIAKARGATD